MSVKRVDGWQNDGRKRVRESEERGERICMFSFQNRRER